MLITRHQVTSGCQRSKGFSLLEMLVAMAVFLLIAGAAFSLFNRHLSLVTQQQNLSSVNIGLRNAMSQLELDLAGAGKNLFGGVQQAGTPVNPFSLGVIIRNHTPAAAGACVAGADWAYPTNTACFDSLTILNAKQCGGANAPVLQIDDPGNSTESLASSSSCGETTSILVRTSPTMPTVIRPETKSWSFSPRPGQRLRATTVFNLTTAWR